jgi:hypothetical protein
VIVPFVPRNNIRRSGKLQVGGKNRIHPGDYHFGVISQIAAFGEWWHFLGVFSFSKAAAISVIFTKLTALQA